MSVFASRLGLALLVAALCPGARTAHAQAAPVPYWSSSWPLGFGSAGDSSNAYGTFSGLDAGGGSSARTNFSNGWFVGSERGGLGLGGINAGGAFGNSRASYYEGMQFGYNFHNSPVTVYAGFDTLKYNFGTGNSLGAFDSSGGTVPGYRAHAGIEFRPTSNLSLSFGVGVTQQSGRVDSDINAPALPGASPLFINRDR